MNSQQYNIDTIANNLANVNTTGYKPMRAEFEDLLYQTQQLAGSPLQTKRCAHLLLKLVMAPK